MSDKKIMCVIITVMCFDVAIVTSAPLLPLLTYPGMVMTPSQQNLQQQLTELQTMQQFYPITPLGFNQLQPFIILLPDQPINMNIHTNTEINDSIESELKLNNDKTKIKDEDEDSVVIDADPIPILEDQKAFLVIPNARLSIGGLISAIPFLPIEINVPDTISWAYNGISSGISGIISIIGSRLPFQRPQADVPINNVNLKTIMNNIQMKNINNMKPLVLMPLGSLSRPISSFQL